MSHQVSFSLISPLKKLLLVYLLFASTACTVTKVIGQSSETLPMVTSLILTSESPVSGQPTSPDPKNTSSNPLVLNRSIQIGNLPRTYQLVIPSQYKGAPMPLVLFLHGRGGSGPIFEGTCGMSRKAEEAGFILVYPDALGNPAAWNAGFNLGRLDWVDDVSFIRQLIAKISQEYSIDPLRIFVGGYSSGGIMSYRLASELSDTIAAIGVMAGTIGARQPNGSTSQIPDPKSPISVMQIHGLKDNVVPYDGYESSIAHSDYYPAALSVQFWVEKDQCNPTPVQVITHSGQLIKNTYSGCKDNKNVVFYTLPGGDHGWPSNSNPINNEKISASDLMWEFFATHPRVRSVP